MEDFREYNSRNKVEGQSSFNVFDMVKNLSQKFDGKNTNDLISAIYKEAEKGKRQGTLSNADLDNFAMTIYPFLDDKKRKYLKKIVDELKKI
jgi:hypothetical protein